MTEHTLLPPDVDLGEDSEQALLHALATELARLDCDPDELSQEMLADAYGAAIESGAEAIWKRLAKQRHRIARSHRQPLRGFRRRLYRRWKEPLDRLYAFHSLCFEAGAQFNDERRVPNPAVPVKLEVATRIHARACQVSSEIISLMGSGFAAGAVARWRTLHELAVVITTIARNVDVVASKYMEHPAMAAARDAKDLNTHHETLNAKPIEPDELQLLERERQRLQSLYGKEFKRDYAWASDLFNGKAPSFRDLENRAGLDRYRPIYNLSLHSVHAGCHSLFYNVGMPEDEWSVLPAGPTDSGLEMPGPYTAQSLFLVTAALLTLHPNTERITSLYALRIGLSELEDAFEDTAERWAM